jgi:hypothetical protein
VPYDQLLQKIITVGLNYAGRTTDPINPRNLLLIAHFNNGIQTNRILSCREFCPMTLAITLLFTLNLVSANFSEFDPQGFQQESIKTHLCSCGCRVWPKESLRLTVVAHRPLSP